MFTPGRKLRNIFTDSRSFDRVQCPVGHNCLICPHMERSGCAQRGCVYLITCKLCLEKYAGESYRPLHDRLMEHRRAANNPASYPDYSLGQHYAEHHPNAPASLSYEILGKHTNTVRRKIAESSAISRLEPTINDRTELPYLKKFLV